jgi:pimeloyl-ACP methyl ester carboxylesterase
MSAPRTIAHEEFGSGPPVVLLHPAGFGPALMVPFARLLAGEHRVVIPHRRGYGASADLALPPSLDTHHDDLSRLIDLLGIERPVVVGISGGATLALGLALRAGPRSTAIGAAMAHEPLVGPLASALHAAVTGRIAHMLAHQDQPEEVSSFMHALVGDRTWDRLPSAWRDSVRAHHRATCHEAELFARFSLDSLELDPGSGRGRGASPDLALVTTVGSFSPAIRHDAARVLEAHGIESRTITGATHLPVFETPAAYAELVRGLAATVALPPAATSAGESSR